MGKWTGLPRASVERALDTALDVGERQMGRIEELEDALRLFVRLWNDPEEPPFGEVYAAAKVLLPETEKEESADG